MTKTTKTTKREKIYFAGTYAFPANNYPEMIYEDEKGTYYFKDEYEADRK